MGNVNFLDDIYRNLNGPDGGFEKDTDLKKKTRRVGLKGSI